MATWKNKRRLLGGSALALVCAALGSPAAPAFAAEAVEVDTIVVTAEKREESLNNIPMAISAFSGKAIEESGVEGIRDLQQIAPSVQFGEAQNSPFISIRGIGSELPNIGSESGVAVSQDGVVLSSRYMFDADFLDVERIEVLRGPQGTIAGRNATGGAINVISRRPTREFEGGLTATIGNYSRFGTEGFLSGPILGDKALGRLAFRTENADGWLKDLGQHRDVNNASKVQGRLSLLGDLGESVEAYLILEGSVDHSRTVPGVDSGQIRPDRPSLPDFFGIARTNLDKLEVYANTPLDPDNVGEKYQATLRVKWDLSPTASLTSTSGYISFYDRFGGDFDGTLADVAPVPKIHAGGWQASQELTLAADVSDRLDVILGGLYLDSHSNELIAIGFPQLGLPGGALVFDADQDLTSYAVYAQARYRLMDDLRVSVGGRYTYDRKKYSEIDAVFGTRFPPAGSPAKASWDAFTPRVALDYTPTDDLTLFASVSRGFKSGGFNSFGNPVDRFEPEYVWSYEAGLKGSWLERRLRTSLTGFYMDYKDLQQSIFGLDPTSFLPSTLNAASATISGAEAELQAVVSEGLRLSASGTWLDAKYDELRSHDALFPELGTLGPAGLNVRDASGNRLVRAPKFQFSLAGEYKAPISGNLVGVLRVNYAWQDKIFFDIFNHDLVSQKSYGILNLYGAVESDDGRWRAAAFANNLLDKRYFTHKFTSTGIGPVPSHLGGLGAPRMYGVSFSYNFR